MTESIPGLSLGTSSEVSPPTEPKRGGLGRIVLAVLLSFFVGGLGQIYARRIRRGLLMALSEGALAVAFANFHLVFTFPGFFISILIRILWHLFITVDAGFCASSHRMARFTQAQRPRIATAAAVLATLLLQVYPVPKLLVKVVPDFGAFKIPSASMCPTICEGDRIVANRSAFSNSSPRRGDIVMMKHPSSEALFIKRVIAIEGDFVTQAEGRIFVNGRPLTAPSYDPGCGMPDTPYSSAEALVPFDSVKVPSSSLFVIGDNLPNSFDSRLPEFGRVDVSQVRGRPLFIYGSWTRSRIGCKLR